MRDHGCRLLIVPQRQGPFSVPASSGPLIALICDDYDAAFGPDGFDRASIECVARSCSAALIVSSAATVRCYAAAATSAVLLRQDVVIVETRPEQELPWIEFIRKHRPDVVMFVSTVAGGNA